jgi:hypothetical protein
MTTEKRLAKRPKLRWLSPKTYEPLYPAVHPRELWSLDHCLQEFIVPRLKAFKADLSGHPCGISAKRWDWIIDEMIYGFEFADDDWMFDNTKLYNRLKRESKGRIYEHPEVIASKKRALNGRRLFAQWFGGLWK